MQVNGWWPGGNVVGKKLESVQEKLRMGIQAGRSWRREGKRRSRFKVGGSKTLSTPGW